MVVRRWARRWTVLSWRRTERLTVLVRLAVVSIIDIRIPWRMPRSVIVLSILLAILSALVAVAILLPVGVGGRVVILLIWARLLDDVAVRINSHV